MTGTVYRVYSPSRGHVGLVTDDRGMAVGRAIALDQACRTNHLEADWMVQTATPRWETP